MRASTPILRWAFVLGLVAFPVSPTPGGAQVSLAGGARIRVALKEQPGQPFLATFDSLVRDTLYLRAMDQSQSMRAGHAVYEPRPVPAGRIATLEASVGRHSNAGKGALIGMGVGAVLGFAVASDCDPATEIGCVSRLGGAAVFGLLGAGCGALIGALSHTEQWEPVPLDSVKRGTAARDTTAGRR